MNGRSYEWMDTHKVISSISFGEKKTPNEVNSALMF